MDKAIAVLGADGRSGQVCVAALLAAGFKVRAGVHQRQLPSHKNMTQLNCDVTNPDDVKKLVGDSQVVVSLIGHGPNSPVDLQTNAMHYLTAALLDTKEARIISLTGTGVRLPGDKPSLIDRILNISIKLIDKPRIIDGIKHVGVLYKSPIDWTVVRVLKLTNAQHNGQVKLTPGGPAELFTPRARVAAAVVDIIKNDSHHRSAPVISGVDKS